MRILNKLMGFKNRVLKSLKAQLIFSFIVLSLSVLIINSILNYGKNASILQKYVEDNSIRNFKQSEYNINNLLLELEKAINVLIVDNSLQELVETDQTSELDSIIKTNSFIKVATNLLANYDNIYYIIVVTETGNVIGIKNSSRIMERRNESTLRFIGNELDLLVKQAYPKTIFLSGLSMAQLTSEWLETTISGAPNHLLVAAKGIKSFDQIKQSATLMILVDEKELSAIYGMTTDLAAGSVFILDDEGRIISSADSERIGESYHNKSILDDKNTFENSSLVYEEAGSLMQAVWYKMENTGWTIVNEIPLEVYTKDTKELRNTLIASFLFSVVIISVLFVLLIGNLTKPIKQLINTMQKISGGEIGSTVKNIPNNELGFLITNFNTMSLNMKLLIDENREKESRKREMELEALQYQINPHFLFNTINTVKWMAVMAGADNIMDCLSTLGKIIQPIFREKNVTWTIEREIEFVENYIRIMRYRYGKSITVNYEIDEFIKYYQVQKMILQPVVENAILHGMKNSRNNCEPGSDWFNIIIKAFFKKDNIYLIVKDHGIGIDPDTLDKLKKDMEVFDKNKPSLTGRIGLTNVNRRLKLQYGLEYGLSIESLKNSGTLITIKFPAETDK